MRNHTALALLAVLLLTACLPATPGPGPVALPPPVPSRAPTAASTPTLAPTPVASIPPAATTAGLPRSTVFDLAWGERAPFRGGLLAGEQAALDDARLAGASVYHLDVHVAGDLTRLDGREEVRYINQEDVSLERLYLRLYPNLLSGASTVTGLTVNGAPVTAVAELENTALRAPLDPPLAPGEQAAAGFEQALYARWERVDRELIPIGLPVREYDGGTYSAIVYGRGGRFFVALEERLGRMTFDAFMRDYYTTYHYGIATGAGLQRLAETHCVCDLAPLFAEWVYPQP